VGPARGKRALTDEAEAPLNLNSSTTSTAASSAGYQVLQSTVASGGFTSVGTAETLTANTSWTLACMGTSTAYTTGTIPTHNTNQFTFAAAQASCDFYGTEQRPYSVTAGTHHTMVFTHGDPLMELDTSYPQVDAVMRGPGLAITGPTTVNVGSSTNLTSTCSGEGRWQSANNGIATVSEGLLTGVSVGSVTIFLQCGTAANSVSRSITVNPAETCAATSVETLVATTDGSCNPPDTGDQWAAPSVGFPMEIQAPSEYIYTTGSSTFCMATFWAVWNPYYAIWQPDGMTIDNCWEE
jgi:hypothetical protein